ncbi:MAG: hypothetical protein ACFFC7_21445 [Candidatus Hermodarchaeota archaeon]
MKKAISVFSTIFIIILSSLWIIQGNSLSTSSYPTSEYVQYVVEESLLSDDIDPKQILIDSNENVYGLKLGYESITGEGLIYPLYLVKWNEIGLYEWSKKLIADVGSYGKSFELINSNDNTIFVIGNFGSDLNVINVDQDGNILFDRSMESLNFATIFGSTCLIDSNNLYIASHLLSEAWTFDSWTVDRGISLTKWDLDGNLEECIEIPINNSEKIKDMEINDNGSLQLLLSSSSSNYTGLSILTFDTQVLSFSRVDIGLPNLAPSSYNDRQFNLVIDKQSNIYAIEYHRYYSYEQRSKSFGKWNSTGHEQWVQYINLGEESTFANLDYVSPIIRFLTNGDLYTFIVIREDINEYSYLLNFWNPDGSNLWNRTLDVIPIVNVFEFTITDDYNIVMFGNVKRVGRWNHVGGLAVYSPDDDSDGLNNWHENILGTDPQNSDSDSDGFSDKHEIDAGMNPTNPLDGNLIFIALLVSIGLCSVIIYWKREYIVEKLSNLPLFNKTKQPKDPNDPKFKNTND